MMWRKGSPCVLLVMGEIGTEIMRNSIESPPKNKNTPAI